MQYILFDLDGTLIDSKKDLANAINASLAHLGLPTLDERIIWGFVGNGVRRLIKDSLAYLNASDRFDEVFKYFLVYYYDHLLDNTKLYDGVEEVLRVLKGRRKNLFVVSNKGILFVKKILEGLKIFDYFDYVVGGDSFKNKKPHPQPIIEVLKRYGAEKEKAILIGDSENDLEAAKNASIKAGWVSYGFRDRSILNRYNVDFVAEKPIDILKYV